MKLDIKNWEYIISGGEADINGALQILNKANISNVSADVKFDQAVKALVVKPVKVDAVMHRLTKEIL